MKKAAKRCCPLSHPNPLSNFHDTRWRLHCTSAYCAVASSFQCPQCRKCIRGMSLVWEKYDEIWAQLRDKYQTAGRAAGAASYGSVAVQCMECSSQGTVQRPMDLPAALQPLPSKCPSCGSYNTSLSG